MKITVYAALDKREGIESISSPATTATAKRLIVPVE